jgi:exodeoxyribonuclease VII large subunit
VGELTRYIRELFELDYRLQDVAVSGEISGFVRARSGHLYFTLKDAEAQLKCVMWRTSADKLPALPRDGDAVRVRGRLSVYEAGGNYQLYAERIEMAGRGNLALAFEQLKQRLAAEGLFEADRKRPLPRFPARIGIVTSADAAALRDILNVLQRRWPLVSVLIAPTLVQGQAAPAQIVRALHWLDGRNDIDLIIVARGGGSAEDLWAFNDEAVVRAIAAADHPVISGVGHEIDFTLADFSADLRAPTPSAAAELAVPDQAELLARVQALHRQLALLMADDLAWRQQQLALLQRTLATFTPQRRLLNNVQYLDGVIGRLERAGERLLHTRQSRLALAHARLHAISPLATLERGYAIVRRAADGAVVRKSADAPPGTPLHIQLANGTLTAETV